MSRKNLAKSACWPKIREISHSRLRNILKDYPTESLFKEMLQNADDAGATEFVVVYDRRSKSFHGTESLFSRQMASWQGPSLYFYNDASFREKDWAAVQKLGQGGKRDEEGKIGRHGLGFNSIYNATDVPSILSGNSLLVFDPHVEHLASLGASEMNAGLKFNLNASPFADMYPDQFNPYKRFGKQFDGRNFDGTVIRAPLRTPDHESKITSTIFDENVWHLILQRSHFSYKSYLKNK